MAAPDDLLQQTIAQHGALDMWPMPAVLLDARGNILTFNQSWRDFATGEGEGVPAFFRPARLGINYLDECRASGPVSRELVEAWEGVRDVLRRRRPDFKLEFSSRRGGVEHWYLMTVSALPEGPGAVIFHTRLPARHYGEALLYEKDSPFARLVQSLPAGVFACDTAGRVTFYNQFAVRMWGRRLEIGTELWSAPWRFYDTSGRPVTAERTPMAIVLREGRTVRARELIVERADGTRSWVLPHPHPLHDASGALIGTVNVLLDITARRQVEQELVESRRRLENVVDSTMDGIMSCTLEGVITSWNRAAESIFGYAAAEIVGKSMDGIVPDDKREEQTEIRERLKRGEHLPCFETVRRSKDGRRINVSLTISPIRDAPGNIVGAAKIVRDITDRKNAENQARERARLLDLATDAIMVADFRTGEILYWNCGAERIYGWSAEEALGRPVEALLRIDSGAAQKMNDRLMEHGEWSGEMFDLTKSGREVILSSRVTLVRDESGQPVSVLSIHTDITERKGLEKQFLRAQRLESVGTLASGVAHDLNNILSPIIMSVPVLKNDVKPELKQKILRTIMASAQRGADIVKQVLTFARGVEGSQVPVNCRQLVEEVLAIAHETFPKSIAISASCASRLWPIVGDPTQLHQVLLNLIINARDAMPAGGNLVVGTSNFTADETFAGSHPEAKPIGYVLLQVSDTGTGIPQAIIDKIFDPFFTTKEIGKGTGLGLSTVLGIVRSHGGFLKVESVPGHGTTFKIFLPASAKEDEERSTAEDLDEPRGKGETILLVDDEEAIRVVAGSMLDLAGYQVLLAADGTEAIALFAQRRDEIKAVITDAAMPFLSGAGLVRAMRKLQPDVRVIGTSGHSGESEATDLKQLALHAFLTKPYENTTLLNTLYNVLHA